MSSSSEEISPFSSTNRKLSLQDIFCREQVRGRAGKIHVMEASETNVCVCLEKRHKIHIRKHFEDFYVPVEECLYLLKSKSVIFATV